MATDLLGPDRALPISGIVGPDRAQPTTGMVPPPSFQQAVQQLITLGERQALTLDQITGVLSKLVQQVATIATTQAVTGQAPTQGMAAGSLFIAPPDLQQWNQLLGASGLSLATIDAVAVVVDTLIPRGVSILAPVMAQYTIRNHFVAVAMEDFVGEFNYHSPQVTVTGVFNFGYSADAVVVTSGVVQGVPGDAIPCDRDIRIPRSATGIHRISHNVTLLFTNASRYAVSGRFSTVFAEIAIDRWNSWYAPFAAQVLAWVNAITDTTAVGGLTRGAEVRE